MVISCFNPCKSKGGHYEPPGKNRRDSFVCNLFRTPLPNPNPNPNPKKR